MVADAIFDANTWARVPFPFWVGVFFVLGCLIGSFLNVCIHRMPIGESIVSPPSHCPHCKYSIPWFLNLPLFTWVYLQGKCANCRAPISARYFLVELLTGILFLGCWLNFGHQSAWLALVYCVFIGGLIVGTFIDFEHFIIPDEITLGGIVVGFLFSFLVPGLHDAVSPVVSLERSAVGIAVGGGVMYAILRGFKVFIGTIKVDLEADAPVVFTETHLVLPGESIPYEDVFYRKSDTIRLRASRLELADRCYVDAEVALSPLKLRVGREEMNPEEVPWLLARTTRVILPREVMGLGDVKLMTAIGAFLGWQAVFFTLMMSAILGSVATAGVILLKILNKKEWSNRLPYVPYIAAAAALWLFGGRHWWDTFWNWDLQR